MIAAVAQPLLGAVRASKTTLGASGGWKLEGPVLEGCELAGLVVPSF